MTDLELLLTQARAPGATLEERHAAFGQVVARFQDLAVGYAYATLGDVQLAEDVAQEAFLTAYHHLFQLREPSAFPGWLRRIIASHCSRLTRGKQLAVTAIERTAGLAASHADPAELAEQRDTQTAIRAAVIALPDLERVAVLLFYFSGYSQHEMAEFLDVPVSTVKKRLQYARQRLQQSLLGLAHDAFRSDRPSRDDRFVRAITFAIALDAMDIERQHAADEVLVLEGVGHDRQDDSEALLSWAAELGSAYLVDLVLHDGLDVDARDAEGRTLLSYAVQRGDLELVALLLRFGADVTLEDSSGISPLERAVVCGAQPMVTLLRAHLKDA